MTQAGHGTAVTRGAAPDTGRLPAEAPPFASSASAAGAAPLTEARRLVPHTPKEQTKGTDLNTLLAGRGGPCPP